MLVGYNTNVPYKGNLYHVQTEDNGVKNPVVITLLYFKGTILSSKKTIYADLVDSPDYKEQVRDIMKEQHKTMIKELLHGKYTGGDVPEGTEKAPSENMEKTEYRESQSKTQISKSLDDILLDYIIKRRE